MRQFQRRLQRQDGAAALEGLATTSLLLAVMTVALLIGTAYYNLSVLNSSAQNIALSAETQLDRYCTPASNPDCTQGRNRATLLARNIATEAGGRLLLSGPIQLSGGSASPSGPLLAEPGRSAAADWPRLGAGGPRGPATPGWGFTYVQLRAPFGVGAGGLITVTPGGDCPSPCLVARGLGYSFFPPEGS